MYLWSDAVASAQVGIREKPKKWLFTEQWIKCPQNEVRNHFLAKIDLKRAQILILMPKSNPAWSICSQLGGHMKDLSKIEAPYGKIEILEWKSEHRQIAARARAPLPKECAHR